MRGRCLTSIAAVLAIALIGTMSVPAAGSTKRVVKTTVVVYYALLQSDGSYQIQGTLKTPAAPICRHQRLATLYVVHPDNSITPAEVKSTKSGLFTFNVAIPTGEGFFVGVAAKHVTTRKSGKRLHCAGAGTSPVYLTPPGQIFSR